MTPIRKALALALVAAAPLFTAQELLRISVVGEADTSQARLSAIHNQAGQWQTF